MGARSSYFLGFAPFSISLFPGEKLGEKLAAATISPSPTPLHRYSGSLPNRVFPEDIQNRLAVVAEATALLDAPRVLHGNPTSPLPPRADLGGAY